MRFYNFNDVPVVVPLNIPHRIVSMEEAVLEYKKGCSVGILEHTFKDDKIGRVLLMDNNTNFICDFDYLVNCIWVVFG